VSRDICKINLGPYFVIEPSKSFGSAHLPSIVTRVLTVQEGYTDNEIVARAQQGPF